MARDWLYVSSVEIPDESFWKARQEHAWLLRAEGFNYDEIAVRTGTDSRKAKKDVAHFSYQLSKALAKVAFPPSNLEPRPLPPYADPFSVAYRDNRF